MLLGRDTFTGDIDDADILAVLNVGRNDELRSGQCIVEERLITERSDLNFFEVRYQHFVVVYATIQGLKLEAEDLKVNVKRLCSHLRKDLVEFGQEVYG